MSNNPNSQTIDRFLSAAGLNTTTGVLKSVTSTIEGALASAGMTYLRAPVRRSPRPTWPWTPAKDKPAAAVAGQFLSRSYAIGAAHRAYKLYVPKSYRGDPVPLIVMLHGCRQNPDDFAAGTRMNELAESSGFLVAYPEQAASANGSSCWNWFDCTHQRRDGIEPSLLAGIVSDISSEYVVDRSRVFVAGLSAGAAMAVILGSTYPEIFKGVAAHSGLPVGAAHDFTSALAAMQRGAASPTFRHSAAVPTIVFHGDADHTVAPSNGATIVEQALMGFAASDTNLWKGQRFTGTRNGKMASTTHYSDAGGKTRIEEWVVHGGSHAWFGGSTDGSYTDSSGPNASAEIVRFFLGLNS